MTKNGIRAEKKEEWLLVNMPYSLTFFLLHKREKSLNKAEKNSSSVEKLTFRFLLNIKAE